MSMLVNVSHQSNLYESMYSPGQASPSILSSPPSRKILPHINPPLSCLNNLVQVVQQTRSPGISRRSLRRVLEINRDTKLLPTATLARKNSQCLDILPQLFGKDTIVTTRHRLVLRTVSQDQEESRATAILRHRDVKSDELNQTGKHDEVAPSSPKC